MFRIGESKLLFCIAIAIVITSVTSATNRVLAQQPIFSASDSVLAIDFDVSFESGYPQGEEPFNAFDSTSTTKYLNFGRELSGVIVTPATPGTTVQSMVLTTANDFPERDPASWEIYGTNDPILSLDNSDGNGGESWTLIGSGIADLPLTRETNGPTLTFSNAISYDSYQIVFPTLRDSLTANSMQIADINLYESVDGSGTTIVDFFAEAIAIDASGSVPESNYPPAESPAMALDGDTMTKYLNFGRENSGFIITPSAGSSVVESFQITTANDFEGRDPASWELWGTNDAIMSADNSAGDGEAWTMIDSGSLDLPIERFTAGDMVAVSNTIEYESYRMVFPTVRDPMGNLVDSMQISEIQFFGTVSMNPVDGDFNNDQAWDCADIDALVAAIASGSTDLSFDMNGDGSITAADVTDAVDGWLAVGGANNPAQTSGNAFLVGDANLDGIVDGLDFIAWNSNKFTNLAEWCGGDFTADGIVDGLDFISWNTNKFMSSADNATVPEPALGLLTVAFVAAALSRLRKDKA